MIPILESLSDEYMATWDTPCTPRTLHNPSPLLPTPQVSPTADWLLFEDFSPFVIVGAYLWFVYFSVHVYTYFLIFPVLDL